MGRNSLSQLTREGAKAAGRLTSAFLAASPEGLLTHLNSIADYQTLFHTRWNAKGRTRMKKVLIVDNDSTNRDMLESLLKGYGLEVTSAKNGRDALDNARCDPPDLIITEILMPVMDGYTLCHEWKSDDILKPIPLVFYTATCTDTKDEEFALNFGADRFIIKPQEPQILMNTLKEVWEENHEGKHGVTTPPGEEIEFLRRHNEFLFRNLEENMLDLEIVKKKLAISEERYHLSFENVTDVILTIDREFNVTAISPSVERRLGYKPEDFIGRPITELGYIITTESLEQAAADIGMMFKREKIPLSVYEFIAKDGERIFGEVSGSLIMRNGRIDGLICVIRDITERKQAEEALSTSEEKFRKAFYTSPDSVNINRLEDGMYISINPGFTRLTGYREDDIIGKTSLEYNIWYNSEDRQRLIAGLEKEGKVTNLEAAFRIKGGDIRYGLMSASVIDLHGVPYILNITRDITDRKQAEEALKESENKYRLLADNVSDVIFVLDMDMHYTYVSPSVKILRGYEPAEVLKQSAFETLTPSSLEAAMRTISEVVELEKTEHSELSRTLQLEMVRKDGTTVSTEVKLSFIRNENRQTAGILGVTRDITERMRAEQRLKDTLENLSKAVGATIKVLVSAVEARDPYTAGHQIRSADLARSIASEMKLPQEKIDGIRMAGSIHDIGKLSIPAELLAKPTKLTDTEFSLIKEHPQRGYKMLANVESPWPLAQIVYQHHERMNGSGYPRNLKGTEILMEARILAVADVVEAMSSHRPYRPALGTDAALDEIVKNRDILYDPEVVDACIRLFHEKGYSLE